MEIYQFPYSIFFNFLCLLLLILIKRSNSKKSIKTLPPGPWKLPLMGSLHHLVGSLPHHSLRDLANKYGPFMHLQLGHTSQVVVSSPEVAKEIMKTHDTIFANRPQLLVSIILFNNTDIGFSPYGAYWRQLRKICTLEVLSAKRVQSFRFIREEEISGLLKTISENEGSILNLSRKLFTLTNTITARAAFGRSSKHVEAILSTMERTLKLGSGFSISDLYPSLKFLSVITGMKAKIERVHGEYDKLIGNIIQEHEEKKGSHIGDDAKEDLVDVLMRIHKQNDLEIPLSLDTVKAVIMDVFLGGTETSATTVEWVMSELLRHPEVMKEAQAEVRRVYGAKGYVDESELHQLKYVEAVIKETLRLHPPLPLLIPRENSESCEINGYKLPSKTRVIINAWAIGRDPKYWIEAEKFKPERFINTSIDYNFNGTNFEYMPFGAGRRICPGITFATALVDMILATLLYHFDWKLPNGMKKEELDMTESFGATVRRKNDLCLVPVAYH